MKSETKKEREARKKRAEEQLALIGRVTVTNLHSKQTIINAMYVSGGNLKVLSALLKVGAPELQRYIGNHSDIAKLWQEIRQTQISRAESAVLDLLDSKNEDMRFRAAKYILDKRGQELGYGENNKVGLQVDMNKEGNISVRQIFGLPED